MTDYPVTAQDASGKGNTDRLLSLSELLPSQRIKLDVRVNTWQEAIREAGRLLFNSGAVTYEYIEAMVKVAEELGPYIVIGPGIALPHAATKSGAKETALSLVKLAEPINFGNADNDPVRFVFGLSAIDKKAHIVALQGLAKLFLSKDLFNELINASTVNSIIETFHRAEEALND